MGCFWSSDGRRERCYHCGRKAVDNLVIIDHQCECCRRRAAVRLEAARVPRIEACYGEYRCQCGRFWNSTRSWVNRYQICQKCRRRVYAHTQRPLRPSDKVDRGNKLEHLQELCQMCQQLGYSCRDYKG